MEKLGPGSHSAAQGSRLTAGERSLLSSDQGVFPPFQRQAGGGHREEEDRLVTRPQGCDARKPFTWEGAEPSRVSGGLPQFPVGAVPLGPALPGQSGGISLCGLSSGRGQGGGDPFPVLLPHQAVRGQVPSLTLRPASGAGP